MKAFTCPSYMYFYYHLSLVSCRFFHLSCCFNFKSDFSCPLYVYCLEFHSASRSNVFPISTFQADFATLNLTELSDAFFPNCILQISPFYIVYYGSEKKGELTTDLPAVVLASFFLSRCFTSTETVRLIGDGGRMGYGMRAQAHLPVHTAPEL